MTKELITKLERQLDRAEEGVKISMRNTRLTEGDWRIFERYCDDLRSIRATICALRCELIRAKLRAAAAEDAKVDQVLA